MTRAEVYPPWRRGSRSALSRYADDLSVFTNMSTIADSEIDQLYTAWGEAFQCKHTEAILDLLTPDYLLWPAGAPAMNRESLRPRLAATFNVYDITPSFQREERLVSGDFAFERGWDVQEIRPRGGGENNASAARISCPPARS